MSRGVYIVANGARTPVGCEVASSAAAIRGAISAIGEHPFLIDQAGDPMPAALDSNLDPQLLGTERFLEIAKPALTEACAPLALSGKSCSALPLYLALPERRPGFNHRDVEKVRVGLVSNRDLPVKISAAFTASHGHAAGIASFAKAMEQIESGLCEVCLVGGIESYFEPNTMEWLDRNLQLAGSVSRSGFVPGEAAGFNLLMSEDACEKYGLSPLARVLSASFCRERNLIKTSDICSGEGLTEVVQSVVEPSDCYAGLVNSVICDVNGERYRAEEWGFVCLRLSRYFDDPSAYDAPADCWGDVGAASGSLFAMLACRAAARGYDKGPNTLIWASSEGGLRAAAILNTFEAN